ncbi:hypothetical protein CDO44_12300 [Pigmentiphaga sp. NML080357]|uniref:DUF423 domain-containing protein n=1 Tax=Pigmentiphaga sp. NML080357 TaxID=2008675 RepID=UPI000B415250|nr:DUF423 domain-containing protein [Pigmentiphaga sp. NML080357]OVZ59386.1 hypothetical protein CDO44_12300 [Pigmentiphaga sp. NML080357]
MLLSSRVLLGCAAPMGAAGVMLAAMATHLSGGGLLSTAALFLLLHAAAVAGLAAMAPHLQRGRPVLVGATALIIAGTLLFSVDLAMRQLAGMKLLWGTAPFGGGAMIVGWLGIAIAALVPER